MQLAIISRVQSQVFFVEIEFGKSKEAFARINSKSLPYIFHIGGGINTEGSGIIRVPSSDSMQVAFIRSRLKSQDNLVPFV